jgi:hypothetical protein
VKGHAGQHDGRGRHRRRHSAETLRWLQLERVTSIDDTATSIDACEQHGSMLPESHERTPPPERPAWLTPATYERLLALREQL